MTVSASDLMTVSGQLGRTARDVTGIAVRCPFGRPAVIETSPTLGGMPNPTLLYLTCPSATTAISRAESAGGVRRLKSVCCGDPELRRALDEVTRAYRSRRAGLAPAGDPRPEAGIGGPEGPETASCLHAYAAALLGATSGWLDEECGVAAAEAWDRLLPPRETLWCTDDRCARWTTGCGGVRVAAIDVGTISVRLLVADLQSGRPEQIFREAEVTRLGEGLRPGERLGEVAASRTRAAVARYAQEARRLGAAGILVAGTSATREAADGAEFIRALGAENQASAVVLSGEEEAVLAYTGASLDVRGDFVVLDVGGGSTELIKRAPDGGVEAVSLDLGASRATERWIASDPPSPRELAALHREAKSALELLRPRFGAGTGRLVGVAGTVTTLACLDAGLQAHASETIHLRTLSLEAVDRLVARLAGMAVAERAALPCVQAGRAQVIVGGAVIVKAAMEALGYEELTVSERDLLDGLVLAAPC
jgi:exopolyphosphatase/guanosine-5'-triphosphate,3'-diphosphate pyrophosphatase